MKPQITKAFAILLSVSAAAAPANADFLKSLKDTVNKAVAPAENSQSSSTNGLGLSQITEGLKEALKVGTERVVGQIGADGGYENDPAIHIPLPKTMQKAQTYLRKAGLSSLADEVEVKLNEGAEAAAPKAKELILKAISDMTLEDARKIYDGPDDAATQYFRKVATSDLMDTVRPVIDQSLQDVGAITAYNKLVSEYKKYPLVPNIQSDLTEHATKLALEGLFLYLATEEAAIRNNPVARTTDILKSVFGGA